MSIKVDIYKDLGSFKLRVKFDTTAKVTSLLGSSGAGKSMTLKCIAGIEKPDEGYIEVNGRVLFDSKNKINLSPQKRKVGYMFQSYALFPNMSVKNNILCGLTHIKDKKEKEKRVSNILNKLCLTGLENHKPSQLSGGQAQRVALARILVSEPEMIMLDEPFSALDEYLRTGLELEMKQTLHDYNGNVLLVTHNRDEAYILSNETVILDNGNSLPIKGTKELFDNPEYLSSAIITGCKNYARCEKVDKTKVFVPDWGISLDVERNVDYDIKYVGIRAHSFSESARKNKQTIKVVNIIEQPFENQIRFVFVGQKEGTKSICWFTSKDKDVKKSIKKIGIDPKDILLLK